ncbi:hypothetical protein JTB14_019342 [Gonioctena quinquepunctata]|nr:hypothetical protein JTB14_019342 [Gonioctena quinquepunctata]
MTGDVKKTDENLKSRDNLDMGSDISKREKSRKSTVESSVRKLKIRAQIEAHEKLDKIEGGTEKMKLQRLKRMQRKITQFKYNQIQTWIDNGSYENFGNHEKGGEDGQTAVDFKEKPNRFEERLSTRQNTPKPQKQDKLIKSAENKTKNGMCRWVNTKRNIADGATE